MSRGEYGLCLYFQSFEKLKQKRRRLLYSSHSLKVALSSRTKILQKQQKIPEFDLFEKKKFFFFSLIKSVSAQKCTLLMGLAWWYKKQSHFKLFFTSSSLLIFSSNILLSSDWSAQSKSAETIVSICGWLVQSRWNFLGQINSAKIFPKLKKLSLGIKLRTRFKCYKLIDNSVSRIL